ncbi:UvrD-helicase domain-containing protein [Arcobacter sp. LA11]|uniref:UvrD-helicase domain-containing protein n=1 Tax=Arcobacter sp. LA11 TaxID=1898176 RepID=UPI0009347547|nr:UvrD-helicase domain-containing protein [Arcobacter sp. LA11]
MNLTKEQIDIINAKEESFKINAVAGSGKTTTLLEYAKNNTHLKILYLAYNKSLQISIQEKLKEYNLSHMKISTIHALAYSKTEAFQYNLCNDLKIQVIETCLCDYERNENQRTNYFPIAEYIALIKDLVNFYCNSSLISLDDILLEKYKSQCDLGPNTIKLLEKDPLRVLNHLKYILSSMKNKKIDVIHDFYLKMFYLNKKTCRSLNYDLILVDEAQDISDVMIGIVESQNCRRIYIGDSFQQIYSFRYATNALSKIDLPEYKLSKSFRFANTYAKVLQDSLNELYKINTNKLLKISGTDNETKIGRNSIDLDKQFCVIARSTFGLIQEIVHLIHDNKKIYFEGGYGSYSFMNQTVYSIFYLKEKKFNKITMNEIKEFESIYELEQFSKETKNQDFLNVIKFINTYGDNIFEINKKIKEKLTTKKDEADIIFTTTHKSKGLEYDQVIMANDFISKKEITNKKNKMSFTQIIEELNIYYVAATRAKKAIDMSSMHLDYKYKADNNTETISYKYKKKSSNKQMKNLQEEWLKKNRIKKAIF